MAMKFRAHDTFFIRKGSSVPTNPSPHLIRYSNPQRAGVILYLNALILGAY